MSKKPPFPPKQRTIEIVLFPGFQIIDAAGPMGGFEIAARFVRGAYALKLVAAEAGLIPSSAGAPMPAEKIGAGKVDTVIMAGGHGTGEAMNDAALIAAVKRAPKRARRVASVCSGAFILAAAGLLAGKTCTTHWRRAPQLARLFPDVRVEPDRIHVQDGAIWTSAGVTAGIDLALAMIEEDLGAEVAAEVAREMVCYAKRPGGQAQHSALLDIDAPRFAALNAWMRDHLGDDLSVDALAARAAMSPRNFARAYATETGVTPAKAVERLRVDAARAALAQGGAIQEVARRTGFGDPERMRRAFIRLYGAPPAALRRTLRSA
ncbi:MAG TPA: GlxA family transcriptional regulator [Vitreimonas sp.]|uniref:GlxA family transcriptional regulator n=1 Tax=Vitreimonas sp. TaxID=3069702 RepID=UPI002D43151A|nr:GlxA family transcriptional regulator [Vitreimonas sp.]HYD89026.1 GlxA family transcriptional regulator [Vitreimonas sp.]